MKRSGFIKSKSPLKAKREKLYAKNKAEYIEELLEEQGLSTGIPDCERCGERAGVDLHHRSGRSGCLLWHKPLFSWLCRECHTLTPDSVHGDPATAERDGWTVRVSQSEYQRIRAEEEIKLYELNT